MHLIDFQCHKQVRKAQVIQITACTQLKPQGQQHHHSLICFFVFKLHICYVHDYDDETYRSIGHNHFLVTFDQDVEKCHFPPVRCLQNLSWEGEQDYDLKVDLELCMFD